ncbi:MAG TPA: hypothetical protein VMU94_06970 [Streptosporangiaceae bacterium]|nr:hypothetical protein [Streptosporangiaceae bacterium]
MSRHSRPFADALVQPMRWIPESRRWAETTSLGEQGLTDTQCVALAMLREESAMPAPTCCAIWTQAVPPIFAAGPAS